MSLHMSTDPVESTIKITKSHNAYHLDYLYFKQLFELF